MILIGTSAIVADLFESDLDLSDEASAIVYLKGRGYMANEIEAALADFAMLQAAALRNVWGRQ